MIEEIVKLLDRERLCVDCLARALKRRRDDVAAALNDLRRAFRLRGQPAVCRPCSEVRMTYGVADAPFAADR
jgi:hypothetical protein